MTVQSASRNVGVELDANHPSVEEAVNQQDLDGLMALYADDASMVQLDGTVLTGAEAIREQWAGIMALGSPVGIWPTEVDVSSVLAFARGRNLIKQ